MGCNDYEPLTEEQREAVLEAERQRQQTYEAQVALYRETAELILQQGARVNSDQLVSLVLAYHEPYQKAVKEAVRRVTLSGDYGGWLDGGRFLEVQNAPSA